jgi:hypothetical protein
MILVVLALLSLGVGIPAESGVDQLTRPGMVRLDFVDQPVTDVVRLLSERTGVPLSLHPDDASASWRTRQMSLAAAEPVPFWTAIDRLAPSAGLILDELDGLRELRLWSERGTLGPVHLDRVFRCRLASLDEEHEVVFGDPRVILHSSFRRSLKGAGVPRAEPAWERFLATVEIMAEPRPMTSLRPSGPPRVIEAVGDDGRSLRLEPDPRALEYAKKYYDENWYAGFDARIYLKTPDPAAHSIGRLHGAIPVILWGRRSDPLEVPLGNAEGRTFRGAGVSLKVVKQTTLGPTSTLTLELNPESPVARRDGGNPLFDTYPDLMVLRYEEQFEVRDASGRSFQVTGQSSGYDAGVMRPTLRLKASRPGDTPASLRYHGLVRVETEVAFDFGDVPLP